MGNTSRRDRQGATLQEFRQRVWQMRVTAGKTNAEVGAELGIDESYVRRIVRQHLAEMRLKADDARDQWVAVQLEEIERDEARAERMIARRLRVAEKRGGDTFLDDKDAGVVVKALEAKRKCREERAKLLGLYAPEKHELSGKGGAPLSGIDIRSLTNEQLAALTHGQWPAEAAKKPDGDGGTGAPPSAA